MGNALANALDRLGAAWHGLLDFLYPVVTSVYNELNTTDRRTALLRAISSTVTLSLSAKAVDAPSLFGLAIRDADVQSTLVCIAMGLMGGIVTYLGTTRQRQKQGVVTAAVAATSPPTVEALNAVVKETASEASQ